MEHSQASAAEFPIVWRSESGVRLVWATQRRRRRCVAGHSNGKVRLLQPVTSITWLDTGWASPTNLEKGWYFLCAGKQYVSFHSGNNSKPPLWFPDPQALQAERSLCISASKVWIRQRISDSIRLSIRVQRQSRKCVNLKRSCWITARTTWKSAAVSLRSNAWRGTKDNQKNDASCKIRLWKTPVANCRTYMDLWGPRSPASWV